MANAYFYTNIAVPTTLTGGISNSATSAIVGATTGWPGSYPFIIGLDFGAANEELVSVTNNSAGTLTIVRGFGGTSAVAHSAGAVVRHVANAVDFTDFRTHEAAIASVHGVTGDLVGATQVQTLTNKTLTAPAISNPTVTGGGSLAGTFTGTPTFSGNVTHTGELIVSNLVRGSRALATDSQYESRVTADANARWFMQADGKMFWGPGSGAVDVVLYREAANTLRTDDQFRNTRSSGTDVTWISQRSADSGARHYVTADGVLTWGDGAGALDTNLYRSAANTLTTDDVFGAATETDTTGLTPAASFSTLAFAWYRTCGIVTIKVQLSYSGATITADSTGNIVDTLCCTLPAGVVPMDTTVLPYDRSGITFGTVTILSDGTCTLKTLAPTATIPAGASINFSATYVF